MREIKHILLAGIVASSALSLISTQSSSAQSADLSTPNTRIDQAPASKTVAAKINTDQGSWMSLDVSPDGGTIVFDLLGDIYAMPASGGTASGVTSGTSWDSQPRFSPDGSHIAFISDRGGNSDLWMMKTDGSGARQVSQENHAALVNPAWLPSGDYIAAQRHKTTTRLSETSSSSDNTIWVYNTESGAGERLSDHKRKTSAAQSTAIIDYDVIYTAASGHTPSADGNYLASVESKDGKTHLLIANLKDGSGDQPRSVYDKLDPTQNVPHSKNDIAYIGYPNMDWGPDNKSLYFWAHGHIQRLDIQSNEVTKIPFQVKDTREVFAQPRLNQQIDQSSIQLRTPRFAKLSPDGKTIVFESLGKLYLRDTKTGQVSNLTRLPREERELYPSWAPDSQSLLFTTWTDDEFGAIHSIDIKSRAITTHTDTAGLYTQSISSPSGEFFLYKQIAGDTVTPPMPTLSPRANPGIYIQAKGSPDSIRVSEFGAYAHFSGNERRIYFTNIEGEYASFTSVNLLGEDKKIHAQAKHARSFQLSPDGLYVAIIKGEDLYLSEFSSEFTGITLSEESQTYPMIKLASAAGFANWEQRDITRTNAKAAGLYWTQNAQIYSVKAKTCFSDTCVPTALGSSLSYKTKADMPNSTFALTNARIITLDGENGGVIENGTILVRKNRIADVGEAINIPVHAEVIDLKGKTIMPGLINVATHSAYGVEGLITQNNREAVGALSQGVTTIMGTSNDINTAITASEMQRAGQLLAPRIFVTAKLKRSSVQSLKAQGVHSLKSKYIPRRDQRHDVTRMARDHAIALTTTAKGYFHHDMGLIQDGFTATQSANPQYKLYDDALQMIRQSGVAIFPELGLERITKSRMPAAALDTQPSQSILQKFLKNNLKNSSQNDNEKKGSAHEGLTSLNGVYASALISANIPILLSAPMNNETAIHRAICTYKDNGASHLEALRAVTYKAAKYLGMDHDIGTIEAGKLADLIILSGNPLDDIRNTATLEHVMIGGRLYNTDSMNAFNSINTHLPFWWEEE